MRQVSAVVKQTYQAHTSRYRHRYQYCQSRVEIRTSDFGSIRKGSCGFGSNSQQSPTMTMASVTLTKIEEHCSVTGILKVQTQ